jgi:hypothetical protein
MAIDHSDPLKLKAIAKTISELTLTLTNLRSLQQASATFSKPLPTIIIAPPTKLNASLVAMVTQVWREIDLVAGWKCLAVNLCSNFHELMKI